MKTIKQTILAIALCVAALTSVNAAVITDSHSGSINTTINYSTGLEEPQNEFFYATSLTYSAWYDTETGEGHYEYTAYGPSGSLHIESETTTGAAGWYWTSYYGEWWMPDFSGDFWFNVWFS